jgi:protocatechuate 3,4-dioxygenase alpha subunit
VSSEPPGGRPERTATPGQTVGPFFAIGLGWLGAAEPVDPVELGALRLRGRVLDGAGEGVPDALVEVCPGICGHHPAVAGRGFVRQMTGEDGSYELVTLRPAPAGGAAERPSGAGAPHLDVSVFARGLLQRLITRVYFPDEEEANSSDPLLRSIADEEARASLVASADDGALGFDVHLQGPAETVFLLPGPG